MQKKRFKPDNDGEFPEWVEVTLGDILEINPKTEKPADEFYYADLASVNNGVFSHGEAIKRDEAPGRAQRVVHVDDVLFQSVNAENMGHYHYTKEKELDKQFVASTGFFQLRMKNGCNGFLYQLLFTEQFNKEVRRYSAGTIYPAINTTEFKKIKVKIPKSIEEQRKIAHALAVFDEMIAVKTKKMETYQELKKTMLKDIFGRTKRFKADDGSEFPEWEEKTLGEVCEHVRNGYSYKPDGLRTHKYKITRIESISTGVINPARLGSCDTCSEKYLLQNGDILYSNINSPSYLGNTAIYKGSEEKIYHGMNLLCIRPIHGVLDADYLFAFLNSEIAQKFATYNAQRAVNQCSIKVSDVRKMKIPFPCIEEQRKIGDFLAEIDKMIAIQKEYIESYTELKQITMREIFE